MADGKDKDILEMLKVDVQNVNPQVLKMV